MEHAEEEGRSWLMLTSTILKTNLARDFSDRISWSNLFPGSERICRGPIPYLTILVIPPALHIFRIQGTGVLSPRRDRLYPAGQPHDIRRGSPIDRCSIPYLTIVVLSPAFD